MAQRRHTIELRFQLHKLTTGKARHQACWESLGSLHLHLSTRHPRCRRRANCTHTHTHRSRWRSALSVLRYMDGSSSAGDSGHVITCEGQHQKGLPHLQTCVLGASVPSLVQQGFVVSHLTYGRRQIQHGRINQQQHTMCSTIAGYVSKQGGGTLAPKAHAFGIADCRIAPCPPEHMLLGIECSNRAHSCKLQTSVC